MSDEEEFTPEEQITIETALAEIKIASPVLGDLLSWVAHNDEYDEEEFTQCLGFCYSYARSINPNLEESSGS